MTIRSRAGDVAYGVRMFASGVPPRHIREWIRSLKKDYLLSRPSPWMTFSAIEYLQGSLKPGASIFEYGSGGSTLFWLRWAQSVVSIEHDRAWYDRLRPKLDGLPVDYRFVEPDVPGKHGGPADPAVPAEYATDDESLRHLRFRTYAQQIDTFEDGSFDLVCVDGRSRPACVVHGAPKVKPGGLLVLDNSDRSYYLSQTKDALAGFTRLDFPGPVPCLKLPSMTSIFTKGR